MDVEILLYPGFDEVDAIGPYEMFQNARAAGADVETALVTREEAATVVASHGLEVGVDGRLGTPDTLVVPGGGWGDRSERGVYGEYRRGTIPDAIARVYDAGATVLSICTGAMLVAEAGCFDGVPATTHHVAHEALRETAANFVSARVVDAGRLCSCGGVTAGFDLTAHFLERAFGTAVHEAVLTEMEYEPRGPIHHAS